MCGVDVLIDSVNKFKRMFIQPSHDIVIILLRLRKENVQKKDSDVNFFNYDV